MSDFEVRSGQVNLFAAKMSKKFDIRKRHHFFYMNFTIPNWQCFSIWAQLDCDGISNSIRPRPVKFKEVLTDFGYVVMNNPWK